MSTKSNTPSATTAELDAYREGYRSGFKAGIAEGKRALRRELKKQTGGDPLRQHMQSVDEQLVGNITHCECPPPWLSPAQQLIRHGLIERAKELQDEGRTQVVQADPEHCPDCVYAARDEGKFVELASGGFALGHAANCMGTGETEGIPRTLAFKCAHCEGSRVSPSWVADMAPRDEPPEDAGLHLGIGLYCDECQGTSEPGCKGVTLMTIAGDVCDAAAISFKAITDREAADIALGSDSRDVFFVERRVREPERSQEDTLDPYPDNETPTAADMAALLASVLVVAAPKDRQGSPTPREGQQLEAAMATEVLGLARYDQCMTVSDAAEVPPALAFRCQHCQGSRTHWAFFEPHSFSEATLAIGCQDCGQHTAITLGVDHCGAHSLLIRKLTAADVAQAKASRSTVKPSD